MATIQAAEAGGAVLPVSPEPLLRSLIGFEISQVLMAAHQLGVFQALIPGPCGVPELCRKLGLPQASGERLLQTCVALNLLEHREEKLSNSATVQTYLNPAGASYIGGLLDYYRADVYQACARLPQAILENRPQVTERLPGASDVFAAIERDESLGARFHQAMHSLGVLEGQRLAGMYPFEKISRLLDVGGGSGALAISLARRHPLLTVDIFDRPPVCGEARRYVEKAGLSARVRTVPGDFWRDPFPQSADAILLSMVLHDWSREENVRLLKKCSDALESGGIILIYEQLLNEDRCGPSLTCLTNLIMLLRTRSGSEYTESEYRAILDEAGFDSIGVTRAPGIRQLLHAVKR